MINKNEKIVLGLVLGMMVLNCSAETPSSFSVDDSGTPNDSESETDDDSDSDSNTESGSDSDTDSSSDSNSESDTDYETDSDTGFDSDTDTDTDTDTATDTDTLTDPEHNYCLSFDGDGDYVRVAHDDSLLLGSVWTLEIWLKPNTEVADQPVFRKGDEQQEHSSYYLYATPYPRGAYNKGDGDYVMLTAETALSLDKWHHLALVNDGSYFRLFVDGSMAGEETSGEVPDPINAAIVIGARLGVSVLYLDGSVDEMRISSIARYNDDFTPQRLFTLDVDTLALWHFDEGSGSQTVDAAQQLVGELHGDAFFFECDSE